MENLAETIRHIPFFFGLSREDLARIVGKLEEESFAAGQVIVSQGEVGDALYVVESGAVEVVLEHDGLRVESVAILGRYECFGEMALFTGQKRSATVLALVDSVVLKLRKETWEELLAQHPSLSLHFCKVLSHRLQETDREISKGLGTFNLVMEEFLAAQPAEVQDFLIRTSFLKTLDPGAIESVLSIPDPAQLLVTLSLSHPVFLRIAKSGAYEYLDYLRDYLSAKLEQRMGRKERDELHLRFASYFLIHAKWGPAIYHYLKVEAWKEALELISAHADELIEREPPKEILAWLDALPVHVSRIHGHLARLAGEAHVRLGDIDAAIRRYQEFLAQKQTSVVEALEAAGYHLELAGLYRKNGQVGEALGSLRLGLNIIEESWVNTDVLQSLRSLIQKSPEVQQVFHWGGVALNVARNLSAQGRSRWFILPQNNKWLGCFLALLVGLGLWQTAPPSPMDEKGMHFLATLAAAVVLWIFEVFDEYIVAIMLLLVWLLSGIIPSDMALGGFSESSWFFVLGVLGIGAAVTNSGLIYRLALQLLHHVPPNYKTYTLILASSGLIVTPLLPETKGRLAIMAPLSQAIAETMGFKSRSNGSAGLALSAYVGFSKMTFMFLTGTTTCLIGWNLLPEPAKSEFGWWSWALAAFPAGIFTFLFLFFAIHLLFPLKEEHTAKVSHKTLETQLEILGPLTRVEGLSLASLALALAGWLGKPLHGISEAWVAIAALLVLLLTRVLDKNNLKNNVDWGYLLFLGVISSLAVIMSHLKIDRWLMGLIDPILSAFSFTPISFLLVVTLLVYLMRFLLNKTATVILLMLGLTPWAQDMGIHPGVLLITILMALDSWFLPYQSASYQISYYSTDEKAFSHGHARKLMIAKFFASLLALIISVPYWRMLGFIK